MNTRESDFWSNDAEPCVAPEHFNKVVASAADLAIVLDPDGTIQTIITNPLNPDLGRLDHWHLRDIREVVTEDSLSKVERELDAFRSGMVESVGSVEINHSDTSNWEFPIRYTIHRTGEENLILMLGRDLRPIADLQQRLVKAQLALEKDYENHRKFETRYRVLLDSARDPFVLINATTGRILDANVAASACLGTDVDALRGTNFAQEFEGSRSAQFLAGLISDADQDHKPTQTKLRRNGQLVIIDTTMFRASGEKLLLCRLETGLGADGADQDLASLLSNLFRNGVDGVVFTDHVGTIRYANEAFLSLCDISQLSDAKGTSFADHLARGNVDLRVLLENASKVGFLAAYSTKLESRHGTQVAVEVSTTILPERSGNAFAFVLRDSSRLDLLREVQSDLPLSSAEGTSQNVIELVGSAPLKDIVAATTDVVEKMCIETAVELTGNNRVAAAEMLGLSRQSLYVKLRKFGLLNKEG